jgi:hypothetical protein
VGSHQYNERLKDLADDARKVVGQLANDVKVELKKLLK